MLALIESVTSIVKAGRLFAHYAIFAVVLALDRAIMNDLLQVRKLRLFRIPSNKFLGTLES